MKSIITYIKEAEERGLSGFIILDMSDESLVSQWGEGDLMKCIHEIQKLHKEDESKEYWIVAEFNMYYDIEDTGNYRVLSSREYNEKEDDFGINPKFKDYLK